MQTNSAEQRPADARGLCNVGVSEHILGEIPEIFFSLGGKVYRGHFIKRNKYEQIIIFHWPRGWGIPPSNDKPELITMHPRYWPIQNLKWDSMTDPMISWHLGDENWGTSTHSIHGAGICHTWILWGTGIQYLPKWFENIKGHEYPRATESESWENGFEGDTFVNTASVLLPPLPNTSCIS